jgi:hypothetical protein
VGAVPVARRAATRFQRASAGKATAAAGIASAQNRIDPPDRTISVKIDFMICPPFNVYYFSMD